MTEEEWGKSIDVQTMLAFVARRLALHGDTRPFPPLDDRRLRLLLVGCCRLKWDSFRIPSLRFAVSVAERYADGEADEAVLSKHHDTVQVAMTNWAEAHPRADDPGLKLALEIYQHVGGGVVVACMPSNMLRDPMELRRAPVNLHLTHEKLVIRAGLGLRCLSTADACALATAGEVSEELAEELIIPEEEAQALLLRCVVGNPFRPVAFDPRWRNETAVALAAGIYAERAFDRLPILADALEEAGCDQPDILAHCRGLGPHARGCWVVDSVLGTS